MSNFKSGSGNLDFGGNNKNDKGDTTDESASSTSQGDNIDEEEATDTPETEQQSSTPTKPDTTDESTETVSDQTVSDQSTATDQSAATEYPYFVRRNNVGDERDTRLEIHVRDKVAEGEAGSGVSWLRNSKQTTSQRLTRESSLFWRRSAIPNALPS